MFLGKTYNNFIRNVMKSHYQLPCGPRGTAMQELQCLELLRELMPGPIEM